MILPVAAPRKKKLITLTPLIDVVFILLLFFMLSSSFIQWRSVDFNTSTGQGSKNAQDSLLLRLHGDGQMDLAGSTLSPGELAQQLDRAKSRDPDINVSVEARDSVALQSLIDVFDQLEKSGIKHYGMLTR